MLPRSRPLSPHLELYRFTVTMAMSIIHRITGMVLYLGTILLVGWLAAAALGEGPLALVNTAFGHWFGQLVLIGYTWALLHHMLGGVRHFIWDTGRGLGPGTREAIAWANLGASIVLTLLAWGVFAWWR